MFWLSLVFLFIKSIQNGRLEGLFIRYSRRCHPRGVKALAQTCRFYSLSPCERFGGLVTKVSKALKSTLHQRFVSMRTKERRLQPQDLSVQSWPPMIAKESCGGAPNRHKSTNSLFCEKVPSCLSGQHWTVPSPADMPGPNIHHLYKGNMYIIIQTPEIRGPVHHAPFIALSKMPIQESLLLSKNGRAGHGSRA